MTKQRSHPGIVGEWKSENWQNHSPDLIIRDDATFLLLVDKTRINVRFCGHDILDAEYKGVWTQPDSQHLTLWPDSKRKMFFPYKIVSVTRNKMVLKFPVGRSIKGLGAITYIR